MIIILKTRKSSVRVVRARSDVTQRAWKRLHQQKGKRLGKQTRDRRPGLRKCPFNTSGNFPFIYIYSKVYL